jgi:hypothetical protein
VTIGHRVFIIEGDAVSPMSQKTFNAFYLRDEAVLPQFASRTIQIAVVLYTLEARKPKQVIRIDSIRVKVRHDGSINKDDVFAGLHLAANRTGKSVHKPQASGNVVDAKASFDQRNWEHRHPELSGPVQRRILDALFR